MKPKKIAIFRALQLGDMLCAIPALRALRMAFPDAEVVLLGLPWARAFVRRFSGYIDRFIHFPGYPGLPEQPFDEEAFKMFLEEVRMERFDWLLQMQGNGTVVNDLLQQFGASQVAGFHNKDSYVSSVFFIEYPGNLHEVDRHLALMAHLGIPAAGRQLEFPLTRADKESLLELQVPVQKRSYVCIHPGSRGAWRQWPPQYFALLADHCAENGMDVLVTGTADEIDITREVIKCMRYPAMDLTGRTSLGAMALLVKDARLLISNCTGVSHIAAALRTPSIVISMDGEPYRWGPMDHFLHKTIDWTRHPVLGEVFVAAATMLAADPGSAAYAKK